jgi:prepilin-type N-terminal cleavage/methylation domain-containing protein
MSCPSRRGFTLLEMMIAMMVLLIGAVGVAGLSSQGSKMNGDSRRVMRATAIAQDLVANIELWPYADVRLANGVPDNDGDIGDAALAYESASAPNADHGEADLVAGGGTWLGVAAAEIQLGGYQRYWNVSEGDDWNANGVPDAKRIAVIVRWPQGAGFRRVVLYTTKPNPADQQ